MNVALSIGLEIVTPKGKVWYLQPYIRGKLEEGLDSPGQGGFGRVVESVDVEGSPGGQV
jgi:hypothetical protein